MRYQSFISSKIEKYLAKFVVCCSVIDSIMFSFFQWMFPTVHNSMKPLTDMNIGRSVERMLKLAVSLYHRALWNNKN